MSSQRSDLSVPDETVTAGDDRRRSSAPERVRASAPEAADESTEGTPATGPGAQASEAPRIGDGSRYRNLVEHGRGGLGCVYRANDTTLQRTVAIKGVLDDRREARDRLRREALITAGLEHPGIVPVHDLGTWDDGKPFYSMKLVSGRTLKDVIAQATTLRERLALLPNVLAVADALSYAHAELIIHRDLKPSNVIVGNYGETMVIDWGLAKDVAGEDYDELDDELAGPYRASPNGGLTRTGAIIGTPAYMPPEQAQGLRVGPRADVYALGAILYHTLSGRAPYGGGSSEEILASVLREPPVSIETCEPHVPADLAAIIAKAMARNPAHRYPSAQEFTDDLRAFTSGQLVGAHDYSAMALLRRWLSKHRAAVAVTAISGVVLLLLTGFGVRRLIAEADRANRALRLAQDERQEVILAHATKTLATDPTAAVAWAKHLRRHDAYQGISNLVVDDAMSRGVARHVLRTRSGVAQLVVSPGYELLIATSFEGDVNAWRLPTLEHLGTTNASPSGDIVFAVDGLVFLPMHDGEAKFWRPTTSEEFVIRGHNHVIRRGQFAPDGKAFFSGGHDGQVRRFDLLKRESILIHEHQGAVQTLSVSSSGGWLATADVSGGFVLSDLKIRVVQTLALPDVVSWVHFAPDGRLITAHQRGWLSVWSTAGRQLLKSRIHQATSDHMRMSSDGDFVVLIGASDVFKVSLSSLNATPLVGPRERITNSAMDAHGTQLILGATDGEVIVEDLIRGTTQSLNGHTDFVSAVAVTDEFIISGSHDSTIRIWPNTRVASRVRHAHGDEVIDIVRSPDGRTIASCSRDQSVELLNVLEGTEKSLQGHDDLVYAAAFSPDSSKIATISWNKNVSVWDVQSGELLGRHGFGTFVNSAAFSESGSVFVHIADGNLLQWRPAERTVQQVAKTTAGRGSMIETNSTNTWVFTPDLGLFDVALDRVVDTNVRRKAGGRYLTASGFEIAIVELRTRKTIAKTVLPFAPVYLSTDGESVFASDQEQRATLWSKVQSWTIVHPTALPVTGADFINRDIVTLGHDGNLALWDFPGGHVTVFREHLGATLAQGPVIARNEQIFVGLLDGRVVNWEPHEMRRIQRARSYKSLLDVTDFQVTTTKFTP